MTGDWVSTINAQCPLRINWLSWEDPVLLLRGADWHFSSTSVWRLVDGERMLAGCEDDSASTKVEALRGTSIIRCETATRDLYGDLRLVSSNGLALEVFVASSVDPWAFRLPHGPTIIPSPGEPNWFMSEPA